MAGDADWTGRVSGFFAAPPDRSRSRRRARYRVFAVAVIWPRKSGQVFGYDWLFRVRRARWFSYSIGER
jgi:hypothetical protein